MTVPPVRRARRGSLLGAILALAAGVAWGPAARPLPRGSADPNAPAPNMTSASDHHDRKPNRLIHENSPYLLQHAWNPVDWYPWGEEAFERARRENEPIFLSIGYSTCHWCHVMERESFENDSVAALLNRDFVCIKVDREQRPDVDRIYMTAMQAMGYGGGWPLNVFLTPDLEPFFGGTYFPPDERDGRPGLVQILPRVAAAWRDRRAEIERTGGRVLAALDSLSRAGSPSRERAALFDHAYATFERTEDAAHGGFGGAPKFPTVVNLDFLLRYWARDPERHAHARAMVERQLDAMLAGGIHDQIGGGFHRYSVDGAWRVPHFEKMLYDQAQLAWAYLEGYQVSARPEYAATARDVLGYVARDLSEPDGGFCSAEDADSEGEEGRFYVWTPDELRAALGDGAELFAWRYGVTAGGNFEHGASVLHRAHTIEETAERFHLRPDEAATRLEALRRKLFEARERRVRPHLDDKVVTAWNGLMISAFARGARVLAEPALAARAARAGEFAWARLRDPATGALHRSWRAGRATGAGQLDDYADLAMGFVDLYGATHDPRWLERAVTLTGEMIGRFWDERSGGFFESPSGDPGVRVRMKDAFDGAEIAGNSIAAWDLQLLAELLDRDAWREKARRTMDDYAGRLSEAPSAMPQMLVAMDLETSAPRHVVVAGDPAAADTRALVAEFDRRFLPHDLLLVTGDGASRRALAALAPFAASLGPRDGRATAYVCVGYSCRLPTTDPAAFAAQLDETPTVTSGTGGNR